ncbi:unnamed protein product [Allacma fusca]|uniref:Uncharacterized protein n=1 Tax=Allacma fusca TaxID=39272 RepID=A0A8J2K4V7_9HEXA|nr:unnamed protein product [Allacma fusca]
MDKKFFPIPKRPQARPRKVGKGNDNSGDCCVIDVTKKAKLVAVPKTDGVQNSMLDGSRAPGVNKSVMATASSAFQGSLVSINQNCKNEPKWSYSLLWTEHGAVLKMIPKEPLLQAHSEKGTEYLPELQAPVSYSGVSEAGVNRSRDYPIHQFGPEVGRSLIPSHSQKIEDADRLVVLPLNFSSPGPRSILSPQCNSDEQIIALITIEKEFLKDICTGKYKSEYVICDLLIPPAQLSDATAHQGLNKDNANLDLGENGLQKSENWSESAVSAVRIPKRCANPSQAAEFSGPPKKRKPVSKTALSEVDRVKPIKLLGEPQFEKSCSINLPEKPIVGPAVSSDLDIQSAQIQQSMKSQFDELDEIQHQLEAISFTKPEILTSSATLASLNSNNFPPMDDLLRRYEVNAWESAKQVKNCFRVVDNNKEGLRRKSTKKPLLPIPDTTSQRRQSPVAFSRQPSLKCQAVEEIQPGPKSESFSNTTSSNALANINTNRKLPSYQPKVSQLKQKPKLSRKNELLNFPNTSHSEFKSITGSLKPKRKSPFDWLDTYFTSKMSPKR